MWYKPKYKAYYCKHTMTPDKCVRDHVGFPPHTSFRFEVLIFPKRRDYVAFTKPYDKNINRRERTSGMVLVYRKKNWWPTVLLPLSASRTTIIHEAVHTTIDLFKRKHWAITRKEEGFTVLHERIHQTLFEDMQWVRRKVRSLAKSSS